MKTIEFTYRSISGMDVHAIHFGTLKALKSVYRNSVTPISSIGGVPVGLDDFLFKEMREIDQAISVMKRSRAALVAEMNLRGAGIFYAQATGRMKRRTA